MSCLEHYTPAQLTRMSLFLSLHIALAIAEVVAR